MDAYAELGQGILVLRGESPHRMHRTLTTFVVASLLAGLATPSANGRAQRHCERSGVVELAADARGRVYQRKGDAVPAYACLRSRDRPVRFEIDAGEVYAPRVTSPFAAAVNFVASSAASTNELQVIDMRNGKVVTKYFDSALTELELTNHGVAVFIANRVLGDDGNVLEPPKVQRMDRGGAVIDLDAGNIDTASLALSGDGRLVYWIKDGVAHSARL
jgi:hypothetical protein